MTKRYVLKGVNDEASECYICGKVELKRVMWLVALDAEGNQNGEAFAVGTVCGARMLGYSYGKMSAKVKNFSTEVAIMRQRMQIWKETDLGIQALYTKRRSLNLPFKEAQAHPITAQLRELSRQAKEWADAQEIVVEF